MLFRNNFIALMRFILNLSRLSLVLNWMNYLKENYRRDQQLISSIIISYLANSSLITHLMFLP